MKRILYLFILLLCFAGCKKSEVTATRHFVKITFLEKSSLSKGTYMMYGEERLKYFDNSVLDFGDNKLSVYNNRTGEKLLDTTLTVDSAATYYVYQPDTTIAPVLLTTLPEPPGEPGNPLNGETAAPAGYMKIKVAFQTQYIFLNQTVDVVVLSTTKESGGEFVPIETLHDVGANYNTDFYLIKRPVQYDESLATGYKFTFIDGITKQPILNKSGNVYTSAFLDFPLGTGNKNLYMFYLYDFLASSRTYPTSIFINEVHYGIAPVMLWKRP